jgi:hypothetical protein
MQDDYQKLRQFNEAWEGKQLFTACIEVMFTYQYKETFPAPRSGLRHAYDVMVDAIQDRVNYYLPNEDGARRKIKKNAFDLVPYTLEHSGSDGSREGIIHLQMLRGEHKGDYSDLYLQWHDFDNGYIRLCLPIEEVMSDPEKYLTLCLNAGSELPFQFGHAGFSMNYEDIYMNGGEYLADPIIGRFPGVNVIHPWFYESVTDGIPTVNWLTFVRNEFVERLGGVSKLKSQEGDGVFVHPLKHGVAIQAGPTPLLGDVNEQESIEPYYRVGEMLAPVKTIEEIHSRIGGGRAQATEWAHRFFHRKP